MKKTHIIDPVELSQALIQKRSVSGETDHGALDVLQSHLEQLGFTCWRLPFEGDGGSYAVDNLYARLGDGGRNLGFAGHTDVVPEGDPKDWSVDPYAAEIRDGVLIGRGAVDMKAAIAAWVSGLSVYLSQHDSFDGSLSLVITGDEEAESVNGTVRMLDWMQEKDHILDACVVGEPTNPLALGEMIKIGRRGSVSFLLEVVGVQGHVAYPDQAENPIKPLVAILDRLCEAKMDDGTEHFPPTNLEVTTVDVDNQTSNLIPAKATARMNIRFNDGWTGSSIEKWVVGNCDAITSSYNLSTTKGSEAFLTAPGELSDVVASAVEKVTKKLPVLSTTGGTSDARFIKDMCPVVECGLINKTAHQVDEQVGVDDIRDLATIYTHVIEDYFAK